MASEPSSSSDVGNLMSRACIATNRAICVLHLPVIGEPLAAVSVWGEFIRCQWRAPEPPCARTPMQLAQLGSRHRMSLVLESGTSTGCECCERGGRTLKPRLSSMEPMDIEDSA